MLLKNEVSVVICDSDQHLRRLETEEEQEPKKEGNARVRLRATPSSFCSSLLLRAPSKTGKMYGSCIYTIYNGLAMLKATLSQGRAALLIGTFVSA